MLGTPQQSLCDGCRQWKTTISPHLILQCGDIIEVITLYSPSCCSLTLFTFFSTPYIINIFSAAWLWPQAAHYTPKHQSIIGGAKRAINLVWNIPPKSSTLSSRHVFEKFYNLYWKVSGGWLGGQMKLNTSSETQVAQHYELDSKQSTLFCLVL